MTSSPWEPPSQNGQTPSGADKQAGRYAAMKDEIAAIQATTTSTDKTVTVVAGPGGAVVDVRVSEQAMKGSARSLSSAIMSTLRLAVADAARRQAEVVQRYVGDRLNIVDRVMATQQEILGDKIEAGEQEQQRREEQPRPAAEEDDGSVLDSVQHQPTHQPVQHQPSHQPVHQPTQQPSAQSPRQRPAEDNDDDDYDPFAWR